MNQNVLVTDPMLIAAVERGDVEGEIYSDGECYCDFQSASHWLREQPVAALELSMQEAP